MRTAGEVVDERENNRSSVLKLRLFFMLHTRPRSRRVRAQRQWSRAALWCFERDRVGNTRRNVTVSRGPLLYRVRTLLSWDEDGSRQAVDFIARCRHYIKGCGESNSDNSRGLDTPLPVGDALRGSTHAAGLLRCLQRAC
jgi:hypothetical protein